METNDRIAQWEKMTRDDAGNAMGWFSLGNAYRDAHRLEDAAKALDKCLELDPGMSRAYQLRAQCLIALDKNDEAAGVLTRGYTVAAEKGDVMPQKAMGSLLEKLGKPVPVVAVKKEEPVAVGANQVRDRKTGRMGARLPDPPMRGAAGRFIYENYSQETWREWIGIGTKVINELRLDFSNQAHQQVYEQHMFEWLGIGAEELAEFKKQRESQEK